MWKERKRDRQESTWTDVLNKEAIYAWLFKRPTLGSPLASSMSDVYNVLYVSKSPIHCISFRSRQARERESTLYKISHWTIAHIYSIFVLLLRIFRSRRTRKWRRRRRQPIGQTRSAAAITWRGTGLVVVHRFLAKGLAFSGHGSCCGCGAFWCLASGGWPAF
jgi:hypothetical protein